MCGEGHQQGGGSAGAVAGQRSAQCAHDLLCGAPLMFTQELGPPRGDPAWPRGLIQTLVILGLGVLSPQPNSFGVALLRGMGNSWPGT